MGYIPFHTRVAHAHSSGLLSHGSQSCSLPRAESVERDYATLTRCARLCRFHPDHQRVGWHVMNTCYGSGSAASNDKLFDDLAFAGLEEWAISEFYFFAMPGKGVSPITHYHELTPTLLDNKIDASAIHRSQYEDNVPFINASVRFWDQQSGAAVGVPYAETYVGYY